jgi:hypothetical protein
MKTVTWRPELIIQQDVDAVRDYIIDFDDWLGEEAIASSDITAVGCTASVVATTPSSLKLRVSAVTATADVTVEVTTSSGQVDVFSINFRPRAR